MDGTIHPMAIPRTQHILVLCDCARMFVRLCVCVTPALSQCVSRLFFTWLLLYFFFKYIPFHGFDVVYTHIVRMAKRIPWNRPPPHNDRGSIEHQLLSNMPKAFSECNYTQAVTLKGSRAKWQLWQRRQSDDCGTMTRDDDIAINTLGLGEGGCVAANSF